MSSGQNLRERIAAASRATVLSEQLGAASFSFGPLLLFYRCQNGRNGGTCSTEAALLCLGLLALDVLAGALLADLALNHPVSDGPRRSVAISRITNRESQSGISPIFLSLLYKRLKKGKPQKKISGGASSIVPASSPKLPHPWKLASPTGFEPVLPP